MFTFFTIVFGVVWAAASFLIFFKLWDGIGPLVLEVTKNHVLQLAAMIILYLIIFGIPMKIWFWLFG